MAHEYQNIVESIGEGIIQVDNSSHITYANPAMCAILGRSSEELLGQNLAQYIAGGADAPVPARLADRRKGLDERSEVAWIDRNGAIVPTRTSEHALLNADGTISGKLSVVTDVTALKVSQRIERELAHLSPADDRLSQLRYARLFETTREALLFIDERSLRVLDANPAATACLGFDIQDLRGHLLGDIPMFADVATQKRVLDDLAKRQDQFQVDALEMQTREGRSYFGDLAGDRYAADGMRIIQLSIRDATERVTALRKVKDEGLRYRAIIEQGLAGIYVLDRDLTVRYVNPRFAEMLGYSPSEVFGTSALTYVSESEHARIGQLNAKHFGGTDPHVRFTTQMKRKDGSLLDVLVDATIGSYEGEPSSNGVAIDITEQRNVERDLVLRNAILTTQQDLSLDAIVVINKDGRVLSQNARFREIFGSAAMENAYDDPAAAIAGIEYLRDHPLDVLDDEAMLTDGRILERHSAPIVDEDGIPQGQVCTYRDITARKLEEHRVLRVMHSLRTLSACNATLIHAANKDDLVRDMCRVIVETGAYPLAMICVGEHDDAKNVRVITSAGPALGFLEDAQFTWSEDSPLGRGPTGTAIRTRAIAIINDLACNLDTEAWRDQAENFKLQSSIAIPLELDGMQAAITIYSTDPSAFAADEAALFTELASDLVFGLASLDTKNKHDALVVTLEKSLEATVQAIGRAVEFRDPYTAGHELRVAKLASAIARGMGLPETQCNAIRIASLVHDVGKINVPSEILTRPGKLTAVEFELIKLHPQFGADILKDIDFPWPVSQIVLQHHERLDGSGYPNGLRGDDIHLEARVIAVADVLESMSSHRPYRPSHTIAEALAELVHGRGTLYEPAAVDACARLFHTFSFDTHEETIAGNHTDLWRPVVEERLPANAVGS